MPKEDFKIMSLIVSSQNTKKSFILPEEEENAFQDTTADT